MYCAAHQNTPPATTKCARHQACAPLRPHPNFALVAAKHTVGDALSQAAAQVEGGRKQGSSGSSGSKAGSDECHLAASNADEHGLGRTQAGGCSVSMHCVQRRRQAEARERMPMPLQPLLQQLHRKCTGVCDEIAVLHNAGGRVNTDELPPVSVKRPRRRPANQQVVRVFELRHWLLLGAKLTRIECRCAAVGGGEGLFSDKIACCRLLY